MVSHANQAVDQLNRNINSWQTVVNLLYQWGCSYMNPRNVSHGDSKVTTKTWVNEHNGWVCNKMGIYSQGFLLLFFFLNIEILSL